MAKYFFNLIICLILPITLLAQKEIKSMNISIESNGKVLVYSLNNSSASKALVEQLPLKIKVKDYASMEKIFYPPEKLSTSSTPLTNARKGTLSYYAPWGDVVLFYKDFGSYSGLYELGEILSGIDDIKSLKGTVKIKTID